jgi:hypothetical protein
MNTIFLRVLDADDKAVALRGAICEPEAARGRHRFEVDVADFAALPRSPFAYWVSKRLRRLFKEVPSFASGGREAWMGLSSGSDTQWLRLFWEIPANLQGRSRRRSQTRNWVPLAKGGEFARFYPRLHLLVDWSSDGGRLGAWKSAELAMGRITANNSKCWNQTKYFRKGLTWSRRTTSGLSLRALPQGCIFGDKGPAAFVPNDDPADLLALLAFTNSVPFAACVEPQLAAADAAARSYEVGVIQRTPVPHLSPTDRSVLAALARRAWSLKRSLDTAIETSHAFKQPALLQVNGDTLAARAGAWAQAVREAEAELCGIQAEIDARCFDLYGIDEVDRRSIMEGFEAADKAAETDEDAADRDETESRADAASLAIELVSWAVGVAFGRFDVRLATGARKLLGDPEPFEPLPVCSPGMLTGAEGLPLASAPAGYPCAFPKNGILVDDPGHPCDLTAAVRAVFGSVFGTGADKWWNEVAALLDSKDHDLRAWIASSFFEHHLKRHSKSRRKAPILWQLGTPSGRYSVWLYVHRLTRDSFFQLQNDVVAPKVAHEERQLTDLLQTTGGSPSAGQRKEIAVQEAFVEELRALLDEVKRVTPLWNPMLEDGVVLAMAPFWRLVPQHKSWQRELKGKWGELADASYDWSQSAMHLWPERVILKCATDQSLAIAHGLEHVFWTEVDGKWKPRPTPTRPVRELVGERTSAAVKAAVKSLLEAPLATIGGVRVRGHRAASIATD